jgi:hypothetical protein
MENNIIPVANTPEYMITLAIEKGVSVETMEKLLAMRRELQAEKAREGFFRDLALFQRNCPIIKKDKEVHDKYGKLRYCYAPLDSIVAQVREFLEKYGFSYTVTTEQDDISVKAICNAHHVAGHSEITAFKVPIDKEGFMSAPQKVASALTYAKRYAFCDAFGIMTGDGDDDANSTKAELDESPHVIDAETTTQLDNKPATPKTPEIITIINKSGVTPEQRKIILVSLIPTFIDKTTGKTNWAKLAKENPTLYQSVMDVFSTPYKWQKLHDAIVAAKSEVSAAKSDIPYVRPDGRTDDEVYGADPL